MTPLNLVPCMVPPLASTKKLIMKSALAGAFMSPLLRLPLAYVASLLPPRPFAPACGGRKEGGRHNNSGYFSLLCSILEAFAPRRDRE